MNISTILSKSVLRRNPNSSFRYFPVFPKTVHDVIMDPIPDLNDGVKVNPSSNGKFLSISPLTIRDLSYQAMRSIQHLFRASHLEQVSSILSDSSASKNDRFVARELLKNAVISSQGIFPSCQDTGTASVFIKRGTRVLPLASASELQSDLSNELPNEIDDRLAISKGIYQAYQDHNWRYSVMSPETMYKEVNTKTNLPADITIESVPGMAMDLLFVAKGGGSANKMKLIQSTRATLNSEQTLLDTLIPHIKDLGTAACPPYHIAIVIGGLSSETTMKTVKLASTKYYDNLPREGGTEGQAFRDLNLEEKILQACQEIGLGAQFGGKYFALDVRVIRLPRHGASLPIGLAVSCSADRQVLARIDENGVFMERLEENPSKYLPVSNKSTVNEEAVHVNLNNGMQETLAVLSKAKVADRVVLSGNMVVARDQAHANLLAQLQETGSVPSYLKDYPVYYAGPAKTPSGQASGSFGPTTSRRMDQYLPHFNAIGASLVTVGKGNRSEIARESCKEHGGVYLGTIGGIAAIFGSKYIKKVEVIDFEHLGMESGK